ncbi:hypothetical protein L1987_50652 [Smallanthus sonchifolius]|uniref:Uncharacterized protein n=1 Tax=Smallanthus sonchifolius TaxID=185202 RepID=A0ACB9EMT9_9ASTR|nr:hypothetical protein L1987_50652 [Smallanthus sonchifolius]
MSAQGRGRRYARNGRRRRGMLDLNAPPVENLEQAGGPALSVDQGGIPVVYDSQVHQLSGSTQPATINLEELDDDVNISSVRAFDEAKNKSRRRTLVVDVEAAQLIHVMYMAEEAAIRLGLIQTNKRRRGHPNPPIINCELYVNLEGGSGSMRERAQYIFEYLKFKFLNLATCCMQLRSLQVSVLLQECKNCLGERAQYIAAPPSPKEPTFSCSVCMGPLVEEVATKCGHIFCKACIVAAIKAQHKCPTCRQKLTNKNLIRVYLPTTKRRGDKWAGGVTFFLNFVAYVEVCGRPIDMNDICSR